MNDITLYVLVGLVAGILSGLMGIGGGIIIIPALVLIFGFEQKTAQGTTLALMVPPIGILAAWTYYKNGCVDMKAAALICAGFFIGGFLGAKFALKLPGIFLEKLFGIIFLGISLRMIFRR